VTASVSDGDLVVEGDADGAVEIVAVSEGAYRVTDNGVVIADETTLQGVTDDIHINLESTVAGTNDTLTIDLAGQTVDKVYAELGDGDNSFELVGGTTELGLGEQRDFHGGCGGGREFGTLALNGRHLGFFYRGFRR
jgi:hypothetical protein